MKHVEEKDILEAFEQGELVVSKQPLKGYRMAAKEHFARDKRINIRMSSHDLLLIKRKAMEEGVPYQTLISSVLHKFVSPKSNAH